MEKRGYLQISFGWLFAIIVGAFILFLAVYGIVKLIGTEEKIQSAKTGEEIGLLINPLETGFESGKVTSMIFPVDTRIYTACNNNGVFGRQLIQVSQKSFKKWTKTDIEIGFSNKYLFSESPIEGKTFYLFSKPFEFPFKVADLIYITSSKEKYCFINPPEEIKEELLTLKQKNIFVEDCSNSDDVTKICFSESSNCNVIVNYNMNYVQKETDKLYFYGDALMYGAIFANKQNYECGLKRLMQRTKQLALLYNSKGNFISQTAGCNSNLDLIGFANSVDNLDSSVNLGSIANSAEEIDSLNKIMNCKLW